ncbi:YihY/virulence factor BrkB family protein [Lichenibacterium dinghuense]|uniref:YihY/virulence factor BrkB family protein n=1 Tax=Lichenibacterium dinghuense TaxID=2895977 RepID=UPI001F17F16D|nr:YihY/virulence factor BrkB family protein [Lichenibacterium sp. 6Y81]
MKRIDGATWAVILRRTWAEIGADRASIVASGVAFRVALALFPAIALLVWVASRTVGPQEARALVGTLSDLVPDASRSIVANAVDSALRSNPADAKAEAPWLGGFAPTLGVAATLWTTNSGTKALFAALNIVYDKEESRGFLRRTLVTLLFTLGTLALLVLALAALLASPVVLSRMGFGAFAAAAVHWLRWPALFVGFAPSLSVLYRYAPNREREHWPLVTVGSTLAAGLLAVGTALFSWFTARFMGLSATYGPLSTVVAFLLWLWFGFYVVLACAELDSVIERRTGLYGGGEVEGGGRNGG